MNSTRINLNKSYLLEINEQKKKICDKFNKIADDEIYEKYNKIFIKTDSQINRLSYENALKSDKRIFSDFYLSIIRTNHTIFFSFSKRFDFNSRILKIFLFFFNFTVYFKNKFTFFHR